MLKNQIRRMNEEFCIRKTTTEESSELISNEEEESKSSVGGKTIAYNSKNCGDYDNLDKKESQDVSCDFDAVTQKSGGKKVKEMEGEGKKNENRKRASSAKFEAIETEIGFRKINEDQATVGNNLSPKTQSIEVKITF